MKKTWTQSQIKLLTSLYPTTPIEELRVYFVGKTDTAIKSKAKILGLKKDGWYRIFTDIETQDIKAKFPLTHTAELAREFNCKQSQINNLAYKFGLKKDKSLLSENGHKLKTLGFAHRYTKGHAPQNKGRKQSEYMTLEKIERTKATRFQKGHKPPNHRLVGEERVTQDGYIEVKVAEGLRCWKLKHRLVWQTANGEIEKGYNIQFKDGNRENCNLDNLYMINRNNQMSQNTIMRYPTEIRQIIKLTKKLDKKIKEV